MGARVRCLVLGGELLGMTAREGAIHVPDDLGGVWWPGLDRVTRSLSLIHISEPTRPY